MIYFDLEPLDLSATIARVRALRNWQFDPTPIEDDIRAVVVEENRIARLSGLDVEGDPLVPIKPETAKRRRQRGDGDGPPLAPNRENSRVISSFICATEVVGSRVEIRAGHIAGESFAMDAHRTGAGRLPRRDAFSRIQPEAIRRIRALHQAEFDRQLTAALDRRDRGFFGGIRNFFLFGS